jgi:LmbE family N-acetylglucosaminyl deacetylase
MTELQPSRALVLVAVAALACTPPPRPCGDCVAPRVCEAGVCREPAPVDAGASLEHLAAVTLPAAAFQPCLVPAPDAGVTPTPGAPPVVNFELRLAERAFASVVSQLAVFQAPGVGDATASTFGPTPWGAGFLLGRVRATSASSWTFEVLAGPAAEPSTMTSVLTGERRGAPGPGSIVELTWDARAQRAIALAVGAPAGDGRVALRFVTDVAGWDSAAVVVAEWVEPGASTPSSTRAACEVQRGGALLRSARGASLRDVDGDSWQDAVGVAVVWKDGVGGRSEAEARAGGRPGSSVRLVECWDAAGERRLRVVNDSGNTTVEPMGGTLARCPAPFDAATLPVPAASPAELELLARAFDGLHSRLTFPQRPQRVLWVGAHPDDEGYYAAPVLGHLCRDLQGTCTLLVVTDGSTGSCRVPAGCPPDLGTFRRAEMVRAAAVYNARLEQLTWPPGPYPSETQVDLTRWSTAAGGTDRLLATIRGVIDRVDPEVLLTFDPRHGGSCHAEHRVVAALTLEALRLSGRRPLVLVSEGSSPPPRFLDARLLQFDATTPSATTGTDAWGFVTMGLAQHPSQVTPAELSGFTNAPVPTRRVYFLRGDDVAADARYRVCSNP